MVLPSNLTPNYRFNPNAGSTGRYIDRRGLFVPVATVTTQMERVIAGTRGEMTMLSRRLQAGDIGLQEWYDGMRAKTKVIHTLDAAIAKGGWAQMTQSDWGAVGAITKQHYQKLNAFAEEIKNGLPLDGRFLYRSGLYSNSSRSTGEDMRRREAGNKGLDYERRVLHPADHCTSRGRLLGCIELEALGWRPTGTLPRIGDTPCGPNDKCSFEFGRLIDGEIVLVGNG